MAGNLSVEYPTGDVIGITQRPVPIDTIRHGELFAPACWNAHSAGGNHDQKVS
jgi:hypothetical protein